MGDTSGGELSNASIRERQQATTPGIDATYMYGDTLALDRDVTDDSVLCLSLNVNGLQLERWKAKNDRLRTFIKNYEFDIMGFQEPNLNWNKIRPKDQWDERTLGWWKDGHNTCKAFNTQDVIQRPAQPGGCMVVSAHTARRKVIANGVDFRGLGRWAWTRYKGTQNKTLRVISAYRPGDNAGAHTVYSQQKSYFDELGDGRRPRNIMMEELGNEIRSWQEDGDSIIVMLDANDHVDHSVGDTFHDLGLKEAIIDRHHDRYGYQPTHQRGRHPIDGIFISDHLQVEAAGYLPFGESPSDHRGLWVKFKENHLFGFKMDKIDPPSARRFKLGDPRVENKWTSVYKKFLLDNEVIQKAYSIQQAITLGNWNDDLAQQYEDLRVLRKTGIELADRQCRKLKMGEVPWSMTIQHARDEIELWLNVVTRKKGGRVDTKRVSRMEKKVGIFHSLQFSLQEASDRLRDSYKRYYELKAIAQELRESWLMELAAIKAKELGGNQYQYYNQLITQERQRISSRRMKRVFGKINGGGLTHVTVTDADGTKHEYTEKDDIEEACHRENHAKFSQTNNTPPMMGTLAEELGFDGTSEACRDILCGNYIPPPGTDQYTVAYLEQLKKPPNIRNPPTATMPTETFKDGWKAIKENISSGISGIHFGHMKACAKDDVLAAFEATMCHIPYSTGYSPKEYQTSVNCMIEKKGKGVEVENLRTINLMECDFNFSNKVIGREVGKCAEENKLLPKEQHGSRKDHQARILGTNKKLIYDLAHFQRRPMIMCSNDAKSCYDRIVNSIASIAMQRLGMPIQPIQCMFVTIQQMEHYIRTGYGDSDTTLSGSDQLIPYQSILQGNGAGPILWIAVSTPLIEMMRSLQHGIKYRTPLSLEDDSIVGFAFVDDTDLAVGDLRQAHIDISDVFIEAQRTIDSWEGGLKTTGGAIRPDKSFVYPISFAFKPSGEYYFEKVADMDKSLTVRDHEDIRMELELVDANVGKETLGMFIAPDGSMDDQMKALKKKVNKWTASIRSGIIPPKDAFDSISTTIMKTLQYPACATTFTRQECASLTKLIHDTALPKAHICRAIPNAIRYGTKDVLGLGLDDYYVNQGIDKVVFYLEHINSDTMSRCPLQANMEWAMIHVGIGASTIFDIDYSKFGHLLPQTWIKSLWEFVDTYSIQMPAYNHKLQLKREHDQFLMEAFHNANYSPKQLVRLNRCRQYLQVETLSDITNGMGDRICRQAYQGQRTYNFKRPYEWPEQPNPDKHHWKLWRQALVRSFPRTSTRRYASFTTPLGPWIDGARDEWKWFFSPATQLAYCRSYTQPAWKVYKGIRRAGNIRIMNQFVYKQTSHTLPPDAMRAMMLRDRTNANKFRLTGWAPDNHIPEPTFEMQEHAKMDWMVQSTYNNQDEEWIVQQLRQNDRIMIVSDGSYHPKHKVGTSAWVITSEADTSRRIYGDNIVPGDACVQCPHRSELSGLIGAVRHIHSICERHNIQTGHIEIGCDGQEAYKIATRYDWKHTTSMGHFDLSSCLHQLLRQSTLHWSFRHVSGHQDKIKAIVDLTIWEQLNMVADAYAKVALWRHIENDGEVVDLPQLHSALPPIKISYLEQDTTIVSNLRKRMTDHIARERLLDYWHTQGRPVRHEDFDKEVFIHAGRNVSIHRQRWLSKWSCGMCGVGKWLERWGDQSHSKCPRCLTDNEDVEHVLLCQHEDATLCWTSGIEEIQEWMRTHNAIPGLAEAVGIRLAQWRNGEEFSELPYFDDMVQNIIRDQDTMGWDHVLFGAVHTTWSREQGEYLSDLGKKTTGTAWVSQFIRRLWDLQHAMWINRNTFVHNDKKSLHQHEEDAIDRVIREEFILGRNGLSHDYAGLFRGNVDRLLNTDSATKIQWIYRVWSGRDRLRKEQDLDPWYKDPLAASFIRRNEVRRKRKRRYEVAITE